MTSLFPITMILLSGLASLGYLLGGQPAKAFYWFLAAMITCTVTFWLK